MDFLSLCIQTSLLRTGAMKRRANGFTLIEVLITILIGVVLTGLAVKGFGLTSSQLSVRQAKNVFNGMAARARARSIETGTRTVLVVWESGDSVSIWNSAQGFEETVHFGGDMGIDIQSSPSTIVLCMIPRGYADPDCNNFSSTAKVTFVQGAETESVEILPLGQIR